MKKVKVLAHRGYRAKFPENSLLAFKKGFEFGADGLECDVQRTKDGKYVIIHDGTIDRTAKDKKKGIVGKMTLKQLKTVDLGKGQSIPEVNAFLKSIPDGKYVNMELKDETLTPEFCPELCDIFLTYIKPENLLVSSFEHSLLPYFKTRNVEIGLLIGSEHMKLGFFGLIKRVRTMRPAYMNLPVQMFEKVGVIPSKILISIFRLLGAKIAFWTVNSDKEFRHAFASGDVIITDEVEFILNKIKEK